jgi:hypothetical protein
VIACIVVVALTLPVEGILLQAISTPSTKQAVRQWVASLSPDELLTAAGAIQSYPVMYRKEIMRALAPEVRAGIWREHIQTYMDTHPHLSSDAIPALQSALALITPSLFDPRGDKKRTATALVADQLSAILGRGEAEYLLYRLGARDEQTASIEPLGMKLTNYVRSLLVVLAEAEDCDCSTEWGCEGFGESCRTSSGCEVDSSWPACGWLWNEDCNGLCRSGAALN